MSAKKKNKNKTMSKREGKKITHPISSINTHYVATGLSARICLPVHGVFTQLSPKMKYFRF